MTEVVGAAPIGPPRELIYRRPVSLWRSVVAIVRQVEIVRTLAERQLRARYKQAMLGFVWALITPIALMIVFTLLFDKIGDIDTHGVPRALFSYVGLLPWGLFSSSVTGASTSIVSNVSLINKIACPREAWPLASVVVALTDTLLSLFVLGLLFVILSETPEIEALWVPVISLVLLTFTIAASVFVAVWVVYVRDLRHGVPLVLQLGLFATPVAYGFEIIPGHWRWVYSLLNPLGPVIDSYRRTVFDGLAPQWEYLGLGALGSTVLLLVSYWMFKRMEAGIADVA